ncbi:MAG TPA: TFIIB-type zinc ribbon-containing protein [Thermaerobacter sp.]
MGRLRQRVAYVSGLAAGLDVAGQTAEGRVLAGILEVLDAMAEEMERLDRRLGELGEYLGELDQDLFDLEEAVGGDEAGADRRWEAAPQGGGPDLEGDDEPVPADFEGAVVFDSGIPTRVSGAAGDAGDGGGDEAAADGARGQAGGEELVEGLLLECPRCGTAYAVARDELEFDREPEDGEQEFEWVCPNCGEVVHDFLPDAAPDDREDPLTAGTAGEAARPAGDGAGQAPGAARSAAAGAATSAAPAPVAPF